MSSTPTTPETKSEKDRTVTIYCAAAFGAFCLGVTDLLKNDTQAIVLKLGQLFREMVLPSWENVPLLALFILVSLGAAMCWLFQPPTRIDAFARGFSVFAVLAVAAPGTEAPRLDASFPAAATETAAPAGEDVAPAVAVPARAWAPRAASHEPSQRELLELRERWQRRPRDHGLAVIGVEATGKKAARSEVKITLRDPRSARIVGVDESDDGGFLTILQRKGRYLVEVEAPGYRRTSFELELGNQVFCYWLQLEKAGVPLGLQRLVAPERGTPKKISLSLD